MKKRFLVLSTLLLCVGMITGCGSKATDDEKETDVAVEDFQLVGEVVEETVSLPSETIEDTQPAKSTLDEIIVDKDAITLESLLEVVACYEEQGEFAEADSSVLNELNMKAEELYSSWDNVLNYVWKELKQTLDKEDMAALTVVERQWVDEKKTMIADLTDAYAGDSMQTLIVNTKAAEMTKVRVYELLEYLE